jgi:glycerol-3-phosphate dehydrogenase subunit B
MASADVVVIGAGLSGLSAGISLAEAGASVFVAAKGMAATHWSHGALDIAAPPRAENARQGLRWLSADERHPYHRLAGEAEAALAVLQGRLATAGLPYEGGLDTPFASVVTPIGGVRPVSVAPSAQLAALEPWGGDEGLLLVGFERFRDGWAEYAARNAAGVAWQATRPARIHGLQVELPTLDRVHNLSSLDLAHFFDDPAWRARALQAIRVALPRTGRWRIGLPAVLGLDAHAQVLHDAQEALGHPLFEVPGLPPSVPGLRLFEALRRRLLAAGARFQFGFPVVEVERDGSRVVAVHTESASRTLRLVADRFVLASGGIAGGGLVGERDGTLRDSVLGLALPGPARAAWFDDDFLATQHPIEAAGFAVDDDLRPLAADGSPAVENVHVVGSALGGMHYLHERCGDGVAIASAARAARCAIGPSATVRGAA